MTIGYMRTFPWGEESAFMEKIIKGTLSLDKLYLINMPVEVIDAIDRDDSIKPKIHTFREDPKDRWSPHNTIHHVYGNRTKDRLCFVINECVWVQRVSIIHDTNIIGENEDGKNVVLGTKPLVLVDGRTMDEDTISRMAVNDGFADVDQFFKYFNKSWSGKIIHWTKLRY